MEEKININKNSVFKVLVAPLDWGLGHATRCIPIINSLLKNGADVILAAEGDNKSLLAKEFPNLQILDLKGYRVQYQKNGSFALKILGQVPSILSSIKQENIWLKKIIQEHNIDTVISDNRFGLHNKLVHTVFLTHQLSFVTGNNLLNKLMQKINYWYINKFDECWIPDIKGEGNLSGALSHPSKFPKIIIRYIGVLSRFKKMSGPQLHDFLFLISGPEPQRTLFEIGLIEIAKKLDGRKVFVRGKPAEGNLFVEKLNSENDIKFFNHLPTVELRDLISGSEIIICRSGYSTIMDLSVAQKRAILIPTPGQKEQEYLAKYLDGKNGFVYLRSFNFNALQMAVKKLEEIPLPPEIPNFIDEAVLLMFEKINSLK